MQNSEQLVRAPGLRSC